jgi:hypothetical protein
VPSNQSLQCISFFSLIIWHLENILHVDKGYCFPWVMMFMAHDSRRYQEICMPKPIGFYFTYVKLFLQFKERNIYHVTAALPSSLLHLFYHNKFLNTLRRCSSTMKTTCLLYILLNTTFLSSEIFGFRLVSVDLLASVRNRQT